MFSYENILESKKNIYSFKSLNEKLIVYACEDGLKFLDVDSLQENLNLKINKKSQKEILFCFSPNKKRLVYIAKDFIYVLDTALKEQENKKNVTILNKIKINYLPTLVSFDPSSIYFFVGTKDNKLVQYRHNSSVAITTFSLFDIYKKRTLGVSAVASEGDLFAVSGNRGDLKIIDIFSNRIYNILSNASVTINNILFLDEQTLLTSHSNGELRIVDVNKINVYTNIETIFTNVKQSLFLEDKRYILVSGNSNYISLLDVKTKKILVAKFITLEDDVKEMRVLSPYSIIVLLENNTLVRIELPSVSHLSSLIVHNTLDEAYKLVQMDPRLLKSEAYINLENNYKNVIQRVTHEIPEGNKSFAIQTLSLFENVACKKTEIVLLLQAFDNYKRFQDFFFDGEHALAYKLANRYPALEQTQEYRHMEKNFKKILTRAQQCLIENKWAEADSLLRSYKTVKSKKSIINLFLTHGSNFLQYLEVLKKKNVERIKEILEVDPLFENYLTYFDINLDDTMEADIEKIDKYLNEGKVDEIEELLVKYEEEEIKVDFQMYEKRVAIVRSLYKLHNEKNFKACYELIDTNDFLSKNILVKSFIKHWKNLILHAEIDALKGEYTKVEKSFSKLEGLLIRDEKMNNLLRLSYQIKIDSILLDDTICLEQTIVDTYVKKFSHDVYITNIINIYNEKNEKKTSKIFKKVKGFIDEYH